MTYSKFHTPHRKSCDFTEIQPSCESEFIHSYPVRPRSTRAAGIWPWLCLPADIKAVRRFILSNQQTRLWNISVSNHRSLFPNRCAPTTSIKSKYVFKPGCGSGSRLEFWSRSSLKGFFLATRNPVNYPNILLFIYIYVYYHMCMYTYTNTFWLNFNNSRPPGHSLLSSDIMTWGQQAAIHQQDVCTIMYILLKPAI